MANVVYMSKTGLTGGEATKLDSIDGAGLTLGDVAFVTVSNVQYIYKWAASTAAESSPDVIAADANGGDNRWLLQGLYRATSEFIDYGDDSTISGWSSLSTKKIYYKLIDHVMYVDYQITGTSDSVSASFTLPYTANMAVNFLGVAADAGGAYKVGNNYLNKSSATVVCAYNFGNFTDSGTKTVSGHFFYEIA